MIVNDYSELNDEHKDVLLELGNIGTGNALTSLSQLVEHPIKMELPKIKILDLKKTSVLINSDIGKNVGVAIKVHGDLECVVTFVLNEEFVTIIANELTGEELKDIDSMSAMQKSAIEEIGNIMCNSYLNAMSAMLEAEMEVSVPVLQTGNSKMILAAFSEEFVDEKPEILFIENTFFYLNQEIISYILLHPKFVSLQKILKRLEG